MTRICRVREERGRRRAEVLLGGEGVVDVVGLPPAGSWIALYEDGSYGLLARGGSRLADLVALVVEAGVAPVHDEAIEAAAQEVGADLGLDALVDFRRLPLVTIDDPHSRDLDQALALEQREDGWAVWYAIADASFFLQPGGILYEDALRRGATYYLPGLTVPMLPRSLSEDRISLNAGVERRALLFELTLDADGRCVRSAVHRARIRSRHKLDFDSVQAFLDGAEVDWDPDVQASLRLLPEVGACRMQRAEERGVVRYRRAEIDVHLDGLRFVAMEEPRNDVERYNEQISLLANIQGARMLREGGRSPHVQPIYRVHAPPAPERLEALRALTERVAAERGLDRAVWVWEPEREPLARYLARLPDDPVARAIHRQAMITNRSSHYASRPGIHHGVGADCYGRFTAPMREVVGVFLHRELWEQLGAEKPDPEHGEALRAQVIRVANRSRELQRRFNRQVNRMVLDDLFEADLQEGRERVGVIMGITRTRVHVQLEEPRVDVKVYLAHLESRHTGLVGEDVRVRDGAGRTLWRLGDRVRVRVRDRDTARDRWRLDLLA